MKWLSPTAHGVLDYTLIMAPTAESVTGACALVCYGLAAAYLLVVLTTTDSMGLVEIIPYRAHGWLELVSGLRPAAGRSQAPRFLTTRPRVKSRLFRPGYGCGQLFFSLAGLTAGPPIHFLFYSLCSPLEPTRRTWNCIPRPTKN